MYKQLRTENLIQKQTIEKMANKYEEMTNKYESKYGEMTNKYESRIKALERIVAYYDNPNTPPSHNTLTRQRTRNYEKDTDEKSPRKQGAQTGHKGTTSRPKPTEFTEHMPKTCPNCGASELDVTDTNVRDITEIPVPKPVTTRHTIHTCTCNQCGKAGIQGDACLPGYGNYGHNIISEIVTNHMDRMPCRLNAQRITNMGVPISTGTIHNIVRYVGTNLENPSMRILEKIRGAAVLNIDETSIRLDGVLVWVWIFYNSASGDTFYAIRPSRGGDVVTRINNRSFLLS